jgi:tetratricopeptide (TPR) repeat protein
LYHIIGALSSIKGDYENAEQFYFKGLTILEIICSYLHPDLAASYIKIGENYKNKGEYDMAEEFYLQCITIHESNLREDDTYLADSYKSFGSIYKSNGEISKADEFFAKCLKIRVSSLLETHPGKTNSNSNLEKTDIEQRGIEKVENLVKTP